jgi:hypothetical protein
VAGLVERAAQAGDDHAADQRRIAEADLGLGGVDVHVDLIGRHVDEQRDHRMAIARQHRPHRRRAPRPIEQAVLHRAAVDEQILVIGDAAIEGRQSGDAAEPDAFARNRSRHCCRSARDR